MRLTSVRFVVLVLVTVMAGLAQPPAAARQFVSAELRFAFEPPAGMFDITAPSHRTMQERAKSLGRKSTLTLLLSLVSGPDDKAPEWHSLSIESYPREKVTTGSDLKAIETMTRWVAGKSQQLGQERNERIGTFHFIVTDFELSEGVITKRARIYTTLTQGQLLSFAFGANSPATLDPAALSMQTIRDYPEAAKQQ